MADPALKAGLLNPNFLGRKALHFQAYIFLSISFLKMERWPKLDALNVLKSCGFARLLWGSPAEPGCEACGGVKLLRLLVRPAQGESSPRGYQEHRAARPATRQAALHRVTAPLSFSEITSVIWAIKHACCNLPEINYKLFSFSCLMIFMNQLEQKIALCKQNPEKTN